MITSFRGSHWFLSNFYPSPIIIDTTYFGTAEHLYQALKAQKQEDFIRISLAETAAIAKQIGRTVALRNNFEQQKLAIMTFVVRAKFYQNTNLLKMLHDTEDEILIEGNIWGDTYWGSIKNGKTWIGKNNLGKILMSVRDETNVFFRNCNIQHNK